MPISASIVSQTALKLKDNVLQLLDAFARAVSSRQPMLKLNRLDTTSLDFECTRTSAFENAGRA